MAEKEFPEIKEKNQGKFTAWAKKNGFKDACSAASAVMKSKKKYSSNVVKMANYANNFGCSTAKSPAKQTDVMGKPYTRTDTAKKVNPNTYVDYAMEYGATPSKREAKKYKRKVRKENSPDKQTDKKIKKMEEKTKRIGIRQGERTRRVEARNKK